MKYKMGSRTPETASSYIMIISPATQLHRYMYTVKCHPMKPNLVM